MTSPDPGTPTSGKAETTIEWTPERTARCCNPLCHPHTMEWHDEFKLWMCESCGCTDQTIGEPPESARESPHGYMRDEITARAKF